MPNIAKNELINNQKVSEIMKCPKEPEKKKNLHYEIEFTIHLMWV